MRSSKVCSVGCGSRPFLYTPLSFPASPPGLGFRLLAHTCSPLTHCILFRQALWPMVSLASFRFTLALNSRHGCPVSGWKPLSSLIAHTCKARLASCSLDLFSVLCFHLPLGPQARSPPVMRDSSFSPGPTFDPPQNLVFCVFFFFFPIRSVKPLAFKSLLC